MNELIYISIGIPFYNTEKYLENAICSVLAQTHKHWELILVDDGSTDKSLSIAKRYAKKDKRIRVLSDGQNRKLPTRLNQIIDESKYDYIARMDADDLMSNDRLEKQLEVLNKNKNIDLVTTSYLTIGKENELTGISLVPNIQMNAKMILSGSANLVHASLLARKSWYKRNLYNEKNLLAEDFELWLVAAKSNDLKYYILEEPLYWYRVIENVNIKKLLQAYNSQIEVIKGNYQGITSKQERNKIIIKFQTKKIIARALSKTGLLNVLVNKRFVQYSSENMSCYKKHISNIYYERKV